VNALCASRTSKDGGEAEPPRRTVPLYGFTGRHLNFAMMMAMDLIAVCEQCAADSCSITMEQLRDEAAVHANELVDESIGMDILPV
jgi:hypothetical protein